MPPRTDQPLALRDLVHILLRHKGMILMWSLFVAAMCIAALFLLPRRYGSDAKLFVRLGRESVTLDPTATTGSTVQIQESRESQINSTRDMLASRNLLEAVVDKLGAEMILKGPSGQSESLFGTLVGKVSDAVSAIQISPPISARELATNRLQKSIGITCARQSSVINVSGVAKSPKLAQEIIQAFLEAYRNQHLLAYRTEGSLEFFTNQSMQLKQQLDYAIGQLRDAKNESNLVAIPVEQQALQTQLTQVEAAEMNATAMLASSEATIASLQNSLVKLPELVTMQETKGFPNMAADYMRQEFFKLQIQTREQEARLGEAHPLVKTAHASARRLEETLNNQDHDRTQVTAGLNTARQTLDLELRREEALAAAYRAKTEALHTQYAALQDRLEKLNDQEVRISDLERQKEIAESNYRNYANHLEQARIDDAIEAYRISNVNVVQQPTLAEKPVSPKPLLIIGLGVLAMFGGGIGLAFGAEYFNPPTKNRKSEALVNVPVLGAIPRTTHAQVFINR